MRNGPKISHYAWWIFPTEKIGVADPFGTKVTNKTANIFLNNLEEKGKKWIEVLNIIAMFPEKIPLEDHGRIIKFCEFWQKENTKLKHVPKWLTNVVEKLKIKFII